MTGTFRVCAALALCAAFLCGCTTDASRPSPTQPVSDDGARQILSPNGKLAVIFEIDASGMPQYMVTLAGKTILEPSKLGIIRDDVDFTKALMLVSASKSKPVSDEYEILTAKRRHNRYSGNEKVFRLKATNGTPMEIIFRVSDDGVAFRYSFPNRSATVRRISEEVSSFNLPDDSKAWLQPMSVAKSGWEKVNPCYEEYYDREISVGTPSRLGAGWIFPALFRTGETWVILTEAGLHRNYCGSRLRHQSPGGEYSIGFPDPREVFPGGPCNPESTLPWETPWRVIVIGSLKTVTESMLGVDLASAAARNAKPAQPGRASWSWPLLGDESCVYEVQKRFIDYAANMGWEYTLIDAHWDRQIGYEKVKELIDYAKTKNVKILLWYNSNGDWNSAPQTPRHLMLTRESRLKEFEKLKAMGAAGLKIDFFGGDGQSMIAYYHDILQDSAPYGFSINFHGATLPRGWHRTHPHMVTAEAIRGQEYVTFEQSNANEQPSHCAMLPFTRNIFDPMDYTPMVLDRMPNVQRRTTSAFELALATLFTSGIQHYAEIPEGMKKTPEYVREYLKGVPAVWEDSRFIAGYPGRDVVMARKAGTRWYVSGINGEPKAKTLELDLTELGVNGAATLITDGNGGNLSFRQETLAIAPGNRLKVELKPHGGFVLVTK